MLRRHESVVSSSLFLVGDFAPDSFLNCVVLYSKPTVNEYQCGDCPSLRRLGDKLPFSPRSLHSQSISTCAFFHCGVQYQHFQCARAQLNRLRSYNITIVFADVVGAVTATVNISERSQPSSTPINLPTPTCQLSSPATQYGHYHSHSASRVLEKLFSLRE